MKWILAAALGAAFIFALALPAYADFKAGKPARDLAEATEQTQNKATALSRSYNDIIPPPAPADAHAAPATERASGVAAGNPGSGTGSPGVNTGSGNPGPQHAGSRAGAEGPGTGQESGEPTPTPRPLITPADHAVRDAMNLLTEIENEYGPSHTDYSLAVNRLQRAWKPRYEQAADEFYRFEARVYHANRMAGKYMKIQDNLTKTIRDPNLRRKQEERDLLEQIRLRDWTNQATNILEEAEAIKFKLDDMNVSITKLQLSATFAAVYDGFAEIPLALALLNNELADFEEKSEEIYETFGPRAGS